MILVLNFGSQFAHLIARRVRAQGVHAEIVPHTISAQEIKSYNPQALILSGGPSSVLDKKAPLPGADIFELGIPILGICYGEQSIAHVLGGSVTKGTVREYGKETLITPTKPHQLLKGWKQSETVWFSHGDTVTKVPKGFSVLAHTKHCKAAVIGNDASHIYGVQFHPEVSHTHKGEQLLKNFLFSIAHAKRDWKVGALKEDILEEIRTTIGPKNHVLVAVSGGVDSLVVATLVAEAIGSRRTHAVLIDTGLLRKNEAKEVLKGLKSIRMSFLKVEDASRLFLGRLKGITDPEQKRKIIGHSFIEVFESYIQKNLKKYPITHLAQGTIYPDRIESAQPNKQASKIKSHHNLTLPEKMQLSVLEPIRELYKDEVRELGLSLGLPRGLLFRHPFPGPGLAIRILGEVTQERVDILREVDAVYMDELRNSGEYEKIWQAFAALLPVKSVGVMGDARTYEYITSLRAVDSIDGMTAEWHRIPPDTLARISNRIVNEVKGVNRVLFDVTQKPPGTIEYE